MKNLILIRHAKSSWDSPMQDFDRPLNHSGIIDAEKVSIDFKKKLPATFVVFSSPAKRARETAKIFSKNLLYPVESIIFSDNLYTFDENILEKNIRLISDDYKNVILFGHNDAITNFVNKFGTVFIDNVPTSGLIWLQFESDYWEKMQQGKSLITLFPKNIK